jgi:hypothetical protein
VPPDGSAITKRARGEAEQGVAGDAAYGAQELRVEGKPGAELEGEGQDPLAQWSGRGQDVVGEVGRGLGHSPAKARGAEAAAFARKRHDFELGAAVAREQRGRMPQSR